MGVCNIFQFTAQLSSHPPLIYTLLYACTYTYVFVCYICKQTLGVLTLCSTPPLQVCFTLIHLQLLFIGVLAEQRQGFARIPLACRLLCHENMYLYIYKCMHVCMYACMYINLFICCCFSFELTHTYIHAQTLIENNSNYIYAAARAGHSFRSASSSIPITTATTTIMKITMLPPRLTRLMIRNSKPSTTVCGYPCLF